MAKKPHYIEVDEFRLPSVLEPEVFRSSLQFKPGKNDIMVVTYPKSGTTWTQQIVLLILRNGVPPLTTQEYFNSLPYLEASELKDISEMTKPRCLKTHLPFNRINYSKEAKYIYVARHPADCVVSFYHHTRYFPTCCFSDGSFDVFFDLFIEGQVNFGDYFDHLLSWYEHRNEPNVFFITYESMKADHRGSVLKIARFLGEEYYQSLMDNDEEVLKKVVHFSSFEYMKSTVNNFWKESLTSYPSQGLLPLNDVRKRFGRILEKARQDGHMSVGEFVRKGEVGDGKIMLSEEQMNRLKARILQKTSHTDIMDLWKE